MLRIKESSEIWPPPLVKNKPWYLPTTGSDCLQLLNETEEARLKWCENILTAYYWFTEEEISQIWNWFGKWYKSSLPNILWQEIQWYKKGVDKKMSKELKKELLWKYLEEKSQQENEEKINEEG